MYKTILVLFFFGCLSLSTGSLPKRKPLHETVEYLQGEERKINGGKVTLDQTQLLLDTIWDKTGCSEVIDPALCQGCIQAVDIFDIVDANKSVGLLERDFERASVVVLHHLENGICKLPKETSANYTYVDYLYDVITTQAPSSTVIGASSGIQTFDTLPENLSFSEDQLHYILELVNDIYKPKTINKCFTSKDVFEDIGLKSEEEANESDVEKLSSIVIANLLRGDCIGTSETVHPNFFIDSIFENYGTFGTILDHDFDQLLEDLGIGGIHAVHEHDNHGVRSWRDNTVHVDMDSRRKRAVPETGRHDHHDDHHDHGHYGHDHHDRHNHEETVEQCFSYKELLDIYEINDNVGSISTFTAVCPALIEQIISKVCEGEPEISKPDQSAVVYGWATLAVFVVTLCSMIGIIIVPLASVKVYTGIMHLFVALAVSTLSGDALLHLIPEALGLHSHGDHQHHKEKAASPEEVLGKVLVVVAAIYAFFLFERMMMVCLGKKPHGHGHEPKQPDKLGEVTESPNEYTPAMFQAGNTIEMNDIVDEMPQFSDVDNLDKYSRPNSPPPEPVDAPTEGEKDNDSIDFENIPDNAQYQSHELTDTLFVERKKKELSARTSFSFTKGVQSISIMVLIGDAVHNMTDGIAIGVAFTLDVYVGISTCLAVFCHELPHEIGDFAVLLKNGLNFRTAFFWSLMSNLCGFIGVYIGIALGSHDSLHQWIFAATAGMFLYIALVDLMPEITHDPAGFSNSVFLMHNIGLVVGWTLMVLLAYFERFMTGSSVPSQEELIPV